MTAPATKESPQVETGKVDGHPMKVSVALATYNGAKWLPEQLESLLSQTLLPYELIIADDGSTDDTLAILEEFRRRAPFPVRILDRDERRGPSSNFVRCIPYCTGDLLAFCDQDDYWRPAKLARCASLFSQADVQLVFHAQQIVESDLRAAPEPVSQAASPVRIPALSASVEAFNVCYGCVLLMRMPIAREVHARWPAADAEFARTHSFRPLVWFDRAAREIANAVGPVVYLPEPLIVYRQHAQSATYTHVRSAYARWLDSLRCTVAELEQSAADHRQIAGGYAHLAQDGSGAGQMLRRTAQTYSRLAESFASRAALRQLSNPIRRIGHFFQMLFRGAYRGYHYGGLGRGALISDAIFSLVGWSR